MCGSTTIASAEGAQTEGGGVPHMSAEAFKAASAEELASRLLSVAVSVSARMEEEARAPSFGGARDALRALTHALDDVVVGLMGDDDRAVELA